MYSVICAAALFAAACNQNKPAQKAASDDLKSAAPKAVEYFHVDPATAGAVKGKVVFQGVKPPRTVISMDAEAACEKAHAGHPVYDESVVLGKDGGLANAFVYIHSGLEGKKFEPAQPGVTLDQHGCMFVPRVIGLLAGQTLDVKNSDTVSHNIHPMPANNREWNQQQSPGAPDLEHKFPRADVMIPVKCNVHSWMRAYIGVLEHPYFFVTSSDGSFEIKDLPPGDYTLAVWHEKFGEQIQPVHLAASGTGEVNFTYR